MTEPLSLFFAAGRGGALEEAQSDDEDGDEEEDYEDDYDAFEGEDDDEEDSEDEDDDDEEDSEDEDGSDEEIAALRRQQKALRVSARKGAVEEDHGDEEEGGEEEGGAGGDAGWGRGRGAYYGGDDADDESDEDGEALEEEALEAMRMQRGEAEALAEDDFGAEGDDDYGASEDDEAAAEEAAADAERRAAAVAERAPELEALLEELRTCLAEVRGKVEPLLAAVRKGDYATKEGLSYLEAKHMLLLSYCSNVAFYVLMRAEGKSVRKHPVIERLVRLRLLLEKARPIDKKLQYLVDKLLAAGAETEAADEDVDDDMLAPRPDRMALDAPADGGGARGSGLARLLKGEKLEGGAGGAYRPPKMRATSMAGDGLRDEEDEGAPAGRRRRRTGRNEELRDVVGHVGDAPEELAEREDRGWALRERRRAERRAAAEEDMFARTQLTRKERLARAAGERQGRLRSALAEFADLGSVGDTVDELTAQMDAQRATGKKRRLSEAVAAAGARARAVAQGANRVARSGDADAAVNRPSLGERRSAHDRSRRAPDDQGPDRGLAAPLPDMSDVGAYAAAEGASHKRKKARAEAYDKSNLRAEQYVLDREDDAFEGRRGLTRQMAKNKGLTPHRKKLARNPRAMAREKFRRAGVRLSGKGAKAGAGNSAAYGGEGTGIKTNTVRSRKFK